MSAMAAAIDGDKIHLFADAVFYDENGVIVGVHPKIWNVPGLNAFFVTRGQGRAFTHFAELVEASGFETWDQLKACLPLIWQELDKLMDGTTMDILIGGFSDGCNRPEILYRTTGDLYEHLEAGVTYIYTEGVCSFGCVMKEADDIPAEAERAFEEARLVKTEIGAGVLANAVGGFLMHRTVTRDDSHARVIKVWDDEVCKKIVA